MIEEVWKREQQAEHEKRKLEEMKKEIQEERKLAELQQDAVDAGHSKTVSYTHLTLPTILLV